MFFIKNISKNRGMTYVELIVVLAIFAIMSAVVIFNYGAFQGKVDVKNLASDIALKVVEAQKSALSGKLPASVPSDTWNPAYGVYFDTSTSNKQFIFFADLNDPPNGYTSGDTQDTIIITKNNSISAIEKCGNVNCSPPVSIIGPLSIYFKRPDSKALFSGVSLGGSDYIRITVVSPKPNITAQIKIYPSGRIQVN